MCRIACNDKGKRLNDRIGGFARVSLEIDFHTLMQANSIFKFEPLNLLRRHTGGIKVLACNDCRLLHKSVGHCSPKRIVEYDVLERERAFISLHKRRGCEL